MLPNHLVIYTVCGLTAVTFIDTVGAIASRKFQFKYVYLAPLSLTIYLVLGYLVAKHYGLYFGLVSSAIVGIYDGTVGWNLSQRLEANHGLSPEEIDKITLPSRIISMMGIATTLGSIGSFLSAV